MSKRKTVSEFVEDAVKKHGYRYDYTQIKEYVDSRTKVQIKCNKCGKVFGQTPNAHLNGNGCPVCGMMERRNFRPMCGVGINDLQEEIHTVKGVRSHSYSAWSSMIHRCYYKTRGITYIGCEVCKEWLLFSNFKKWFDDPANGYKEGYQLDKDIIVKGNKVYSPQTCCLVPKTLNTVFTKSQNKRGPLPIGVARNAKAFQAYININGKRKGLGTYKTPEEAFYKYKEAKEAYIKEIAKELFERGNIVEKVYNALMNYKVEITD